jgi:hypothetical protein
MIVFRILRTIWKWFCELGHANEPERRSQRLLRDWLSIDQLAQYDKYRYFEVVGCDSGRRYRVQYGTVSNISELDANGRPILGWCFVPRDNLASGDVMLAQKIALETNERGALKIARSFSRWRIPS